MNVSFHYDLSKRGPMKSLALILIFIAGCSTQPKTEPLKPVKDHKGVIDAKGIQLTFKKHEKYIRNCYQKSLSQRGDQNLSGIVTLSFTIDPSGAAEKPGIVTEKTNLVAPELC